MADQTKLMLDTTIVIVYIHPQDLEAPSLESLNNIICLRSTAYTGITFLYSFRLGTADDHGIGNSSTGLTMLPSMQ